MQIGQQTKPAHVERFATDFPNVLAHCRSYWNNYFVKGLTTASAMLNAFGVY